MTEHKPSWIATAIAVPILLPWIVVYYPIYLTGRILNVVGPMVTGKN